MPESVRQERYPGYTLEVNVPERYNTNFFVCDFYWANSSGCGNFIRWAGRV